jgi:tRNA(Ile)-lysidine synthetase-like protein
MKYVVAVSGGVDSVVLLDMLVKESEHELLVAHFDHGIRDDSAADARFVEGLAARYGLAFVTRREELGKTASEEQARTRRYRFLNQVTARQGARLVTAHHQDDLIETITINLSRGTGWRGLAVFNGGPVVRPLLARTKAELYDYALTHNLEWVEDETNASDRYLRNRLRRRLAQSFRGSSRQALLKLWHEQTVLRQAIDQETANLLSPGVRTSRHFFTQIDEASASELLRALLLKNRAGLTRNARLRMLQAIKTAQAGTRLQPGAGIEVEFTRRDFIVKGSP